MKSNLSALFDTAKKVALVSVPEKEEIQEEPVEQEIDEKSNENIKVEREYEDPEIINAETVFVGNVPTTCTQKELKKLFSQFGNIKSVRLRNLIPLNPKRGKRLAFIKKELHPLQKSITAYIRFDNEDNAQNAISLNGHVYKDHHLRVDLAHEQNDEVKHDYKRSIFIGNLPFDVTDDDVWNAFEQCGQIENVRLIRDKATSVGKGFGYVLFEDEASVALALKLEGNCLISNRQVRIKTAMKKPKANNQRRPPGPNRRPMKPKHTKRRNDDSTGVKEGRVEKRPAVKLRKEKQKKKKKNLSTKTNNSRKDVIQLKKKK